MTVDDSDMLASGAVRVEGSTVFLDPELQHLGCYTGGMFALGGKLFGNKEHVDIGRKLSETCVWAYKSNPSGIMPEVAHLVKCANTAICFWDDKAWHAEVTARADLQREADPLRNIAGLRLPPGFSSIEDRRYILRPEAIESVFVLYRITGEQSWQAAGWDMWTSIMRVTDTDIGNAALLDISADTPPMTDSMEVSWHSYYVFRQCTNHRRRASGWQRPSSTSSSYSAIQARLVLTTTFSTPRHTLSRFQKLSHRGCIANMSRHFHSQITYMFDQIKTATSRDKTRIPINSSRHRSGS